MRHPRWDNNGMKKGSWSPDEDQKLTAYINRYGIWNWTLMPKYAGKYQCQKISHIHAPIRYNSCSLSSFGFVKNGKSCRLRWLNYLNPKNKRGNITDEEARTIFSMYAKLGKRWSAIAAKLPGRTDNEIKNYWHTHFKKQVKEKVLPKTQSEGIDVSETSSSEHLMTSYFDSTVYSSPDCSSVEVSGYSLKSTEEDPCDFWSQPFSYENNGQEPHFQAWCHCREPSSPYAFYNSEYCFGHLLQADLDGWNEYRISSSPGTILDN